MMAARDDPGPGYPVEARGCFVGIAISLVVVVVWGWLAYWLLGN